VVSCEALLGLVQQRGGFRGLLGMRVISGHSDAYPERFTLLDGKTIS
jgi:hypothetical protein